MERYHPPSHQLSLYSSFLRIRGNEVKSITLDDYFTEIMLYECEIETHLIDVLYKIGIEASVKTDRYSLPYKHEFRQVQVSYRNIIEAFDFQLLTREIVNELIREKVKKIRFYLISDLILEKDPKMMDIKKTLISKIRYSTHKTHE
jgi:hypothetical protein